MSENYYKILGVSSEVSLKEIRKKYIQLSLIHHPDRLGGDAEEFKKIDEAYKGLIGHHSSFPSITNMDELEEKCAKFVREVEEVKAELDELGDLRTSKADEARFKSMAVQLIETRFSLLGKSEKDLPPQAWHWGVFQQTSRFSNWKDAINSALSTIDLINTFDAMNTQINEVANYKHEGGSTNRVKGFINDGKNKNKSAGNNSTSNNSNDNTSNTDNNTENRKNGSGSNAETNNTSKTDTTGNTSNTTDNNDIRQEFQNEPTQKNNEYNENLNQAEKENATFEQKAEAIKKSGFIVGEETPEQQSRREKLEQELFQTDLELANQALLGRIENNLKANNLILEGLPSEIQSDYQKIKDSKDSKDIATVMNEIIGKTGAKKRIENLKKEIENLVNFNPKKIKELKENLKKIIHSKNKYCQEYKQEAQSLLSELESRQAQTPSSSKFPVGWVVGGGMLLVVGLVAILVIRKRKIERYKIKK